MNYINTNRRDYARMVKEKTPKTRFLKTLPAAFFTGGIICALGEVLIYFYSFLGFQKEDSFALSSCTLILLTAVLTGLNIFDEIAAKAGAGTLVPITGFANAVASPALEFKREGFIRGLGAKIFVIAGPVIVYGLAAGVIYGFIIYIFEI